MLVLLLVSARTAWAQVLPSGPVTLASGRVVVSGQAAVSAASGDPGYFDYSSYDDNLMRQVRLDGSASFRVSSRLFLIGDLRAEGPSWGGGSWRLRPYAAFVRIRPWPRLPFDVQAGIIPPVFGSFSRQAYAHDNPLIGFPLAYQYLTSLRADAVPSSADDLLATRARGSLPRYPAGSAGQAAGLPLVDGLRYQSGVEVHAGSGRPLEATASLTSGSLSVPAGEYARGWRQVAGRMVVRPLVGLVLGVSGSSGVYLARSLTDEYQSPAGRQAAIGLDAEFSRGHWVVRTEEIASRWHVPRVSAPFIERPLAALASMVEARYRILPGLYAAGRLDHIGFSSLAGTAGTGPWEAPVTRLEVGGGYSLGRNLLLKATWQHNWRDAGTLRRQRVVAAQVVAWF